MGAAVPQGAWASEATSSIGRAGTRFLPLPSSTAAQMVPWVCSVVPTAGLEGGGGTSVLKDKSVFWNKKNMAHQASCCWACSLLPASEFVLIEEYGTIQLVTESSIGVWGDVKINAALGQIFFLSFKRRTWQMSRNEQLGDRKCLFQMSSPSSPASRHLRPRQPKWVPFLFNWQTSQKQQIQNHDFRSTLRMDLYDNMSSWQSWKISQIDPALHRSC